MNEEWSNDYKKKIDCSNPKGFSQKAHCAGHKKRQAAKANKIKTSERRYGKKNIRRKNAIIFRKECTN